ncbi:MAG: PAS domain S-box protein [Alphaproteobacteria bacterium]|nr:PAS domain S-box protein [Alphaproteobacteria bacterium]
MKLLSSLRGQLVLALAAATLILAAAGVVAILWHGHHGEETLAALVQSGVSAEAAGRMQASLEHDQDTMRAIQIVSTAGSIALLAGFGWFFLIRRTGRRLDRIREALMADIVATPKIDVGGNDEIAAMARAAERRLTESAALAVAEKAVNDERLKLRSIIEHGTSAILTVGLDGRIESANPAASQLFLRPVEAMVGLPVEGLFREADEAESPWAQLCRVGRLTEIELDRHDGTRVPIEIAAVAIRDGGGAVSFHTLIAHDLSRRRAMERQLREAEAALRERAEAAAAEAHARLHELMSSTSQGILVSSPDDRVMLINDAFLDTFLPVATTQVQRARVRQGMAFDELFGLFVESGAFGPEGPERARLFADCHAARARGDGSSIRMDLADGRHVVFSLSRTHDGGLLSIVTDVSDVVQAMERLKQITDNVPALIAHVDADRRVQFTNRTGEQWHARPASEMAGRRASEFLSPESLEVLRPLAEGALRGETGQLLHRHRFGDGVARWVNMRYVPEHRSDGTIAGYFVLGVDDTEALQTMQDLAAVADNLPVLIARVDAQERYQFINKTGARWYRKPVDQIVGRTLADLMTPEQYQSLKPYVDAVLAGEAQHFEYELKLPNGDTRWLDTRFVPQIDPQGEIEGYYSLVINVTERRDAEEQLRHIQRLETVGQLTGGIAHDFNNILGVVLGNLDLLTPLVGAQPMAANLVQRAIESAERGASLTHRLLAFGRRQTLLPRQVDIGVLITEMGDLLERTLSDGVEVKTSMARDLWPVVIDPVQLESAILNLAINARDAGAREIHIDVANETLTDTSYHAQDFKAGNYVAITVRDDGRGMTPEVLDRALEPFFTTKEIGKGTGLGLSMVYGFVKQSGGHVTLSSMPGQGSAITLFLPRGVVTVSAPATAWQDEPRARVS